jgi:hypothetical protein
LFWFVFLMDGVVSFADELMSSVKGSGPLTAVRGVLALAVLAMTFLMVAIIGITPRAPRRILIPLIFFAWWAGPAMAFPLALWNVPHLGLGLATAQVLLALGLWYFFQVRHAANRTLSLAVRDAPAFSWRHLFLAGPASAVVFIAFAAACILLGLSTQVESLTGGYVRVRPDGVYLVERKFQSGDREVRLAGMMHIARQEFYSGLLPAVDPAVPSVVLVEGVTDRRRLLGGRTLDYGRLARVLNVTSQTDSAFSEQVTAGLGKQDDGGSGGQSLARSSGTGLDFKHADVDVETFHPMTIAFILAAVALFQSSDLRELIKGLADPSSPIADENAQKQVVDDILFARNQRLVAEIESSLKDYRRVVVPWGAMHLPEVESWLRDHNFVQSGEMQRKALGFW